MYGILSLPVFLLRLMRKRTAIFILTVSFPCILYGQQIDWALYDTVQYSFNPSFSSVPATVGSQQELFCSWLGVYALNYNQRLYGTQVVHSFLPSGSSTGNHFLGPKATISALHLRPNGDLIVSGSFMDTLYGDGTPLFPVNSTALYDRNAFIVCFSSSGTIRWSRNISLAYPGLEDIDAEAVDPYGKYWYASMSWGLQQSVMVCLGDAGQDSIVRPLPAVQALLSDMAFDASGAVYLCGGIGSSTFLFGGLPVSIASTYNRFLAKMDPLGQGRWFRTIDDITFQAHHISINDSAQIYFTGDLYDSITVDGFHLDGPDWVFDHMTVKFDSSGAVLWANDVPNGPTITGDLQLAGGSPMAADDSGYYQIVRYRGTLVIGNGLQIGTGTPSVSYGFSLIRYDHQGIPQWHTDVPTVYGIYPMTVLATSFGGYILGTASGSQQIGPVTISVPSSATFFSWAARFSNSGTAGMDNVTGKDALFIYPNPSVDGRLNWTDYPADGKLFIYDMTGRMLLERNVGMSSRGVNTGLPAGNYFVRIGEAPPVRWTITR
jgi:hypothetical protein